MRKQKTFKAEAAVWITARSRKEARARLDAVVSNARENGVDIAWEILEGETDA